MSTTCAIVPAAGRGLRMGRDRPKQFLEIAGRSILLHTLDALAAAPFLAQTYLLVPEDFQDEARGLVCGHPSVTVAAGGAERQDSVLNGLRSLPDECGWVLIHDGVRPFVSSALLEAAWKTAQLTGAAIAAVPVTDTVKRSQGGTVVETLNREEIWLVQTPQVFRRDIITSAYEAAVERGWVGTDDASFVERLNLPVSVVLGERTNVKVTTPEDLDWAQWFLSRSGGPAGKISGRE
ncbi:MAG TPA: 2-C-methyl-D-erythritol 4-phosphate cytidylyltransferase [Syntrophobacter fumaroxidans]|nr:2-C-methyl-D-erythritol 4-phosphate cytidylyltransferase [Syntrophobacter fumaroxidans]